MTGEYETEGIFAWDLQRMKKATKTREKNKQTPSEEGKENFPRGS